MAGIYLFIYLFIFVFFLLSIHLLLLSLLALIENFFLAVVREKLLRNPPERIRNSDEIWDWSHEETMAWLAQWTQLSDEKFEDLNNYANFNGSTLNVLATMSEEHAPPKLKGVFQLIVPSLKAFLAGGKGLTSTDCFRSHGYVIYLWFLGKHPSSASSAAPQQPNNTATTSTTTDGSSSHIYIWYISAY